MPLPPRREALDAQADDYLITRGLPIMRSGKISMQGFDEEFKDIVDYILVITDRIWLEKNIGAIARYYAKDCRIHTLAGPVSGSAAIINSTIKTLAAFPDRLLNAEDVIWGGNDRQGFYSSHRLISPKMSNLGHSEFGPPTGKQASVRTIADCAVKDNQIYEEWLVRDNMGLVQQLGLEPHLIAQQLAEQNRENTALHSWLAAETARLKALTYRALSSAIPAPKDDLHDFVQHVFQALWHTQRPATIASIYTADVVFHGPGGRELNGHSGISNYIDGITASLSGIKTSVDHVCRVARENDEFDVAIRWTLVGVHDKAGIYGEPSYKNIFILAVTHWHIKHDVITEEWTVFDELAVMRQIYE